MDKKKEVSILELAEKLEGVNVHINKDFLSHLLIGASGNQKPHCDFKFISKLRMKPTDKYLSNTIYGWVKYGKSIPLKKLSILIKLSGVGVEEVERNINFISTGRTKLLFCSPIKIDEKMGSIVGHVLGDGSIDKKYRQVFFSNSNKELLKEFANYMECIFNVKPRIWMQKDPEFGNTHWDKRLLSIDELADGRNGGLFYPTICGLILNVIFDNFAVGKDKEMTSKIIKSSKEFKRGLIRAFYDDESSVGKKNIRLFQDKKDMLNIFRDILEEFDILASNVKCYIKRDKKRFYFDIFKKSNFLKFRNEIGFTSSQKNKKLNDLCIIKNFKNSR